MKNFRSTFIPKFFGTLKNNKCVYLLMEKAGYMNLSEFFEKFLNDLKVNLTIFKLILIQKDQKNLILVNILKAIKWLHSTGLVHNDIKPTNIMISKDLSIKLIDFGFSIKKINDHDLQFKFNGTPSYLSPQKIQNLPHDGK